MWCVKLSDSQRDALRAVVKAQGELGRLPKRGDMVRVNGYSLRVESVRENRVEAVRIRDHDGARSRETEPAHGERPVEEAAATPRGQARPEPAEGGPGQVGQDA